MIVGQYRQDFTYPPELSHPVWQRVITWISTYAKNLPDGEHGIAGQDIFSNIHTANTVRPEEGMFEVHKTYIDLHYCLTGGERIAYEPKEALQEKTPYNAEKDYQLFVPNGNSKFCLIKPDSFAIFFPREHHMPKIQDGTHPTIRKVVVKIKASLL